MPTLKGLKGHFVNSSECTTHTGICNEYGGLHYTQKDVQQALSEALERLKKKKIIYCVKETKTYTDVVKWQDVEDEFR